MPVISPGKIVLDYGAAASSDLLGNLSGAAAIGDFLWTVSDEGRTLECLARQGRGFVLSAQLELDGVFSGIPGADKAAELDLESIDIADGHLWLCGSHCLVRAKPVNDGVPGAAIEPNARIKSRPSRHLLGAVKLTPGGGGLGAARALPFEGPGSLRDHLADNEFLKPFLDLPSKENGFDIEGLAVLGGSVFIGLRGPLIDSYAMVVELSFDGGFRISASAVHFLDLGGLAVRELARGETGIFIIAGPVSSAAGPFKLMRWTPLKTKAVQSAHPVHEWRQSAEKPEGLTMVTRGGKTGLLVLHDSPGNNRINGSKYSADWRMLS